MTYLEDLLTEKRALDERIAKLAQLLANIEGHERFLIDLQLNAMKTYGAILLRRMQIEHTEIQNA